MAPRHSTINTECFEVSVEVSTSEINEKLHDSVMGEVRL